MATHFRTLTIEDVRRETAECVSVAFAIPPAYRKNFAYHQGQNITLRTAMNGEEIRRSYSICSSPAGRRAAGRDQESVEGGLFST